MLSAKVDFWYWDFIFRGLVGALHGSVEARGGLLLSPCCMQNLTGCDCIQGSQGGTTEAAGQGDCPLTGWVRSCLLTAHSAHAAAATPQPCSAMIMGLGCLAE